MKSINSRPILAISLVALVGLFGARNAAHAQFVSGTIFGTGYGSSPGSRDSYWKVAAVPSGFTPPSGQAVPYDLYVPTTVPGNFYATGNPQPGVVMLGGTNYWIAPQATTASLLPNNQFYNWIAQQQFYVPVAGFYRFDFPGAGDNELEFYIDGTIDASNPVKPTITGGQQIGNRAGTFTQLSTFTGGAVLAAGTHTASMVLWDYGGATAALIATSTFAPAVGYWAPGVGAGGNGTWNNSNAYWTTDAQGLTTKQPWTNGIGYAYFGGTSGTVSVSGSVGVTQMVFNTGGYTIQSTSGTLHYASGGTITANTGTTTISATQDATTSGVTVKGAGTVVFSGATDLGYGGKVLNVAGGNLLVTGAVNSAASTGIVTVGAGSILGGTGMMNVDRVNGAGLINPGLTGSASGILTAKRIDPSGGMDFQFAFSGTVPTFGNAADSTNDILRLSAMWYEGGNPFSSALTSANSKTLFLNFTKEQLTVGTGSIQLLKGGFFTDEATDFVSKLNNQAWDNGGFQVYVLGDGNGTDNSLNGQGYYNWRNPAMFGWDQSLFLSTTPQTANFAGGTVNGQIMTLAVGVPEPSTYAMGIGGAGFLAIMRWSRRRSRHCCRGSAGGGAGHGHREPAEKTVARWATARRKRSSSVPQQGMMEA